jgi:hypothetical protein
MIKRNMSFSTLDGEGHRVPPRTRPEATVEQLKNGKNSDGFPKKLSILGAGDYEIYKPMVSF